MTKLYDLPFENRIRQKYLIFGVVLGFTGLAILLVITRAISELIQFLFPQYYKIQNTDIIGFLIPFMMFIPLLYYMWYSKAKPRKHPHLNETVGLKDDWDKVQKL